MVAQLLACATKTNICSV